MRSFKRLFSLLLIAALMLGIVPMTAFAQENFALGADSAEILYAGGRQADGFFVGQNGSSMKAPTPSFLTDRQPTSTKSAACCISLRRRKLPSRSLPMTARAFRRWRKHFPAA